MFNVLGSAALRGSVRIDVASGYRPTDDITILTATDGISLIGGLTLGGPDARYFSGISVVGNNLVLHAAAVPEPASLTLFSMACGWFGLCCRGVRSRSRLQLMPVFVGGGQRARQDGRTLALLR
jgi:hypothetical protein